jgi:hypothetical protein
MSGAFVCDGGEGLVSYPPIVTVAAQLSRPAGAPQFAAQIGSPHVRWRGASLGLAALTAALPPVFSCVFSILGTDLRSVSWQLFQPYLNAQTG